MESVKPVYQSRQVRSIFIRHGHEFQAQATTRLHMPYDRLGPDSPILHKEINSSRRTNTQGLPSFERQPAQAQIPR